MPLCWEAPSNQATALSIGMGKDCRRDGLAFKLLPDKFASVSKMVVTVWIDGIFSLKIAAFLVFQTCQHRWIGSRVNVLWFVYQFWKHARMLFPVQFNV